MSEYKALDSIRNFRRELSQLINEFSLEGESNTPDFILADYLNSCLEAFDKAVRQREKWHGRPGQDFKR